MSKQSVYFDVEDMHTKSGKKRNYEWFKTLLRGVFSVSINDETRSVTVDFDNTGPSVQKIEEKIMELGYHPVLTKNETHVM